ncbi:Mannosyl-oligosaccharide alpha-1,2-mannosidase isoform A [Orchesella cincta]|uniref:alpha-1,2-Mannosidase n=1 Tax=Orchesella cincta TaxID=48709 RepID=A0A1D2MHS4_ORCCI|nr:Mannosyl-oligosaccharide alpha-1,2-mannosidase isoform A [Orchesella cincta]
MKVAVILLVATCVVFSMTRASPLVGKPNAKPLITQGGEDPDPIIRQRRDFVKQMMKDAWEDYVRFAWGQNELKPISQTGQNGGIFGNAEIAATAIDSLDTLYIMEMMDDYQRAKGLVTNITFTGIDAAVSIFETNIRIVGGFLTAYALTQDRVSEAVLAEFGTLHLEFMYLSDVSGDVRFREKALKIREVMKNIEKPKGLYWNFVDVNTGRFTRNHVSIGALADSYYEYLLKAAIQLDDAEARQMYDDAMDGFVNNSLVKISKPSNLLYIAESRDDRVEDVVGHLACFAGGMFALGAHVDPTNKNAVRDAEIGRNFTNTCHESYIRTATKIGPEVFRFNDEVEAEGQFDSDKAYILRPEVMESYLVLYRLTNDTKYRDWGWDAAQAIERYTKAGPGRGYSGIRNVDSTNPAKDDVQQTFFLAETLKYLYLLFSTNDLISLDQWVFNTECHPLPIKGANPNY